MRGDRWQPSVDVFETDGAIVIRAEVPGVSGEQIKVTVDGDLLRISGMRAVPESGPMRRLHQMEIAFGPFERTLRVHTPFARDQVAARLEDGFLHITLPKRGQRRIEVESG